MTLLRSMLAQFDTQRENAFLWTPVCFGLGIAVYLSASIEPKLGVACSALVFGGAILSVFRRSFATFPGSVRLLIFALAVGCAGFGCSGVRTYIVAEPVLSFRYYGPIEGRIVKIDRSQSGAVRLTFDNVVLQRIAPNETPNNVRVSLHGNQGFIEPEPGQVVMTTGHLSPPSGPVEPGGFDFQRMAWFQGLGAVGYTRNPVVLARPASEGSAGLWVYRLRTRISSAVQGHIEGEVGGFAAAIITGDRSSIGQDSLTALRASNLAHLLAISGMHMGILAAFVFGLVRYGFALWPSVALRFPTKKWAAVVALTVAAFYLALSGGNIATQRAFIMVAVMLLAVLCDRRALTLRAVAIAAMIVLIMRPEALFGPGFQMSFAATAALVAVFGGFRNMNFDHIPRWLRPIGAVVVSSLVAGLATAPIAAFHFNQIAQYGLVANLLSVPLMGTVVMPAAVLAALLAPIGLAGVGLWVMEQGLSWILGVAHFVASQDGALRHVVTPDPVVLTLIALGGLWIVLWRGSLRWIGTMPAVLGLLCWQIAERPALLVAESGSLIGVMSTEGRHVSKERGESFAATSWLENDGAPVPQEVAYNRDLLAEEGRSVRVQIGDQNILNIRGVTALRGLDGCGGADILITNQRVEHQLDCIVYDQDRLRETGALAGWDEDGALRLVSTRDHTGDRIWNTDRVRERKSPLIHFFERF